MLKIKKIDIKKSLLLRTISAIILGPLFIFMLKSNQWGYFTLFNIIMNLCIYEFQKMIHPRSDFYSKTISFFSSNILYSLTFINKINKYFTNDLLVIGIIVILLMIVNLHIRETKHSVKNISLDFLCFFYISLPFSIGHNLAFEEQTFNWHNILLVVIIVWSTDIGGYIFGNLFGRHCCFARISPKKTWEGIFGGFFVSIIATYIFGISTDNAFVNSNFMFLAPIGSLFSIYGDFLESLFKRHFGIKDSGSIIPGHGGLLDRFDGYIFTIIAITFYKQLYN